MNEVRSKQPYETATYETEKKKMDKLLNLVTACSEEELCELFNTSAFNEIARSYLRLAVRQLVDEGIIEDEQARAVRNRFSLLFDEKTAQEVMMDD